MAGVQSAPLVAAAGHSLLFGALVGVAGVQTAGLITGSMTTLGIVSLLWLGLRGTGARGLGTANAVTLARAILVSGVVALVTQAYAGGGSRPALVLLAAVALALDWLDGQVARRTGSETPLGARFDMEVDALLILALSALVAGELGWWVLLIGLARYLLWAGSVAVGWLGAPSPPRPWAKVVAAVQGIVLTVAAARVLPEAITRGLLAVSLALLVESFGRQAWWLWRHRGQAPATNPRAAAGVTALAAALIWAALAIPDRATQLVPVAPLRIPAEALVAVAVATVLPGRGARAWTWLTGLLLAVVVFLKAANLGFTAVLDRPFDPLNDRAYVGPGIGVLADSIGRPQAIATVTAVAATTLAVLVILPLCLRRVVRTARAHRSAATVAVALLAVAWLGARAADLRLDPRVPVASTSAAQLAVDQIGHLRADLADRDRFAAEIGNDPYAGVPPERLLTGLRGHDVLVVFVESYGRIALEGSSFAPDVTAALDEGSAQLDRAGYRSRSAFLTSPTFGAASWLAHSTLQSGLWVDSQQRYNQLLLEPRVTLSEAFRRAGWRTVFDDPAVTAAWPQGEAFYHYDQLYDGTNVGYRGPAFSYATMPDQFTLAAFRRLELDAAPRPPVMAEIDLISSHHPWTPLPRLVPWDEIGDGSVFEGMPEEGISPEEAFRDPELVRRLYGQSVIYSWQSLVSFLAASSDPGLVVVVLGDHQPHSYVTGPSPGHDVPISVISRDPAVLQRIEGWGWHVGIHPPPEAPVWRMDEFRDAFLTAFH